MIVSQTPLWVTIIGTLGISSFVSTVISLLASAYLQHKNWINDNKKAEYRELLDALYETVTAVSTNRPNLSTVNYGPINDAVKKLARVFEDRIFIGGSLTSVGALQDWYDMKRVIYYEPNLQTETPREFWYSDYNLHEREDKLRNKILELAHKDIVKFKTLRR